MSLRQFAENQAVVALKQVPDVQSVGVYGGAKRQLRVVVDRDKLAAYGYSILDVRDAIDRNSVAKPAGVLTSGPDESIVRVADLAQNAPTVADYPLGAKNGQLVSPSKMSRRSLMASGSSAAAITLSSMMASGTVRSQVWTTRQLKSP